MRNMLSIVKLLYFILIVVLLTTFAVTSFTTANGTTDSYVPASEVKTILEDQIGPAERPVGSTENANVRSRIITFLTNNGYSEKNTPSLTPAQQRFTYEVQTAKLTNEDIKRYATAEGKNADEIVYGTEIELNNIIVRIKGVGSSTGTIAFFANYDSVSNMRGGATDAAAAASMLYNIQKLNTSYYKLSEENFVNDLVFVFTDAKYNANDINLGAYAFADEHSVVWTPTDIARMDNIKVAFNFDSYGAGGTMVMLGAYGESDILTRTSKLVRNSYYSSLLSQINEEKNTSLSFLDSFGQNTIGVTFSNFGKGEYYKTQLDTPTNLSDSYFSSQGALISRAVNYFGRDFDLNESNAASNQVFFSYLNIFVFRYHVAVTWVLLVIMLALLGFIIFLNKSSGFYNPKSVLKGLIVQLSAVAISMLAIWLITLGISLFGLLNVNVGVMAGSSTFSSVLFQIAYVGMALFFSLIVYSAMSKLFKIKARNVVYGNTLLFAFLSVVSTIFFVGASYLFTIMTILQLVILLVMHLVEDKYKARYGESTKLLALNVVPYVLLLPLYLTLFIVLGQAYGVVAYPLLVALLILPGGFAWPYIAQLKTAITLLENKIKYNMSWYSESIVTITLFFFSLTLILVEVVAPSIMISDALNLRSSRYNNVNEYSLVYTYNTANRNGAWTIEDADLIAQVPNQGRGLFSKNSGVWTVTTLNSTNQYYVDIDSYRNTQIDIAKRTEERELLDAEGNGTGQFVLDTVYTYAIRNSNFFIGGSTISIDFENIGNAVSHINVLRDAEIGYVGINNPKSIDNRIDVSGQSHVNIEFEIGSDEMLADEYIFVEFTVNGELGTTTLPTINICEQNYKLSSFQSEVGYSNIVTEMNKNGTISNLRTAVRILNAVDLNELSFNASGDPIRI